MPRKLALLLTAALCVTAYAEEVDQPAWSAPPQAYAAVSNIVAVREPFSRALVLDQAFVEVTPEKSLRFWFRFFGPNYRIYSEAGEARKIRQGVFLYSGGGDDIASGRQLANLDCYRELAEDAPAWEKALQATQ